VPGLGRFNQLARPCLDYRARKTPKSDRTERCAGGRPPKAAPKRLQRGPKARREGPISERDRDGVLAKMRPSPRCRLRRKVSDHIVEGAVCRG